jgi:hypothetical protein
MDGLVKFCDVKTGGSMYVLYDIPYKNMNIAYCCGMICKVKKKLEENYVKIWAPTKVLKILRCEELHTVILLWY